MMHLELRRFVTLPVLMLGMLATAFSLPASAAWITSADYAKAQVVVSDQASPSEKEAAQEFAQYWHQATGGVADVVSAPEGKPSLRVWIGREGAPDKLLEKVKLEGLGTDGLCIRTFRAGWHTPAQLLVVGGKERGTQYGVYQFLKDYLGIRFLTPADTYVPAAAPKKLPKINTRYVPEILRRQMTYTDGWSDLPPAEHDLQNKHWHISSYPDFGLFVHTSFDILPPQKYFKDHPEYYSMIDGKRRAPADIPPGEEVPNNLKSQLCWSNPAVADAVVKELIPRMRAHPEQLVWSVSQMDWFSFCQCPECQALNEQEGTPMGSLLTGINRVADAIKDEFPNDYIETLAYAYSRKPPAHLKPRDNVIISLCAIEGDYARPLSDKSMPQNRYYSDDIEAWSKIAKHLFIWDYPASCAYPYLPFPDFHVLQPNFKFYADHKVMGAFLCGGGRPITADLGWLRAYMLAELMWNPNQDAKKMMDEYIALYYQEAAPYIHEYIDLLTDKVVDDNVMMDCFDRGHWIDADTVAKMRDIMTRAYANTKSPVTKQRLDDLQLSVDLSAIIASPKLAVKDGMFSATRPEAMSLADFLKKAQENGLDTWGQDKDPMKFALDSLRIASEPPRHEASPIEVIENDRYLVWVLPEMKGSIVRWQDKQSGEEFLRGYKCYGAWPGTWQDWGSTPQELESASLHTYTVTNRTPDSLTLRAVRKDGLVVDKTITLKPGSDELVVSLTQSNSTDAPIQGNVKSHPEFFSHGMEVPEVWLQKGNAWEQTNLGWQPRDIAHGEYVKPDGYTGAAFYLPTVDKSIVSQFDPAQLGGVLWFFNTTVNAQQCNIELLPKDAPLAPGAFSTVTGTYRIVSGRPGA